MKNWEKWEKEIREYGLGNIALVHGKIVKCNSCSCDSCQFKRKTNDVGSCFDNITNWLYEERRSTKDRLE